MIMNLPAALIAGTDVWQWTGSATCQREPRQAPPKATRTPANMQSQTPHTLTQTRLQGSALAPSLLGLMR